MTRTIPTAAEIAPADHADHALVVLFDRWRESYMSANEPGLNDGERARRCDRADDALEALARQPAQTVAGASRSSSRPRGSAA